MCGGWVVWGVGLCGCVVGGLWYVGVWCAWGCGGVCETFPARREMQRGGGRCSQEGDAARLPRVHCGARRANSLHALSKACVGGSGGTFKGYGEVCVCVCVCVGPYVRVCE